MKENRPKIGVALSGASGRAFAHIAVLKTLKEQGIPVDVITACSSGAIIAAAYAAGGIDELQARVNALSKSELIGLFRPDFTARGLVSLDRVIEEIKLYTYGKRFEDLNFTMSFTGCDIYSGEGVSINTGDLATASAISSAVPGLFKPGIYKNRIVVDGGLHSIIPVEEARKMGADIVIAVDVAASRFMIKGRHINFWKMYRKIFFGNKKPAPRYDKNGKVLAPNLITMYDMAFELAVKRRKHLDLPKSEFLIDPKVKHLGKMEFDKASLVYEAAKNDTMRIVPELKKLMENYEQR